MVLICKLICIVFEDLLVGKVVFEVVESGLGELSFKILVLVFYSSLRRHRAAMIQIVGFAAVERSGEERGGAGSHHARDVGLNQDLPFAQVAVLFLSSALHFIVVFRRNR